MCDMHEFGHWAVTLTDADELSKANAINTELVQVFTLPSFYRMEEQPLAIKVLAVPELVDLVQVYLDSNSDLVSLTQVSKAFSQLFNPLIWQTIEIRTERQHRQFVSTPQVQDAIRRQGGNWIRVIRIRTPKSLTPFIQANVPLLQLHTLEFPWPRRLVFEDVVMKAKNLQPFEEELDVLNEPYPNHFFLEREKFHRTRSEPALSMNLGQIDDQAPVIARSPSSLFWLQQRRKSIWRLELDNLHLSLRMVQSEVRFRQAVEDMFHLQQSQEAMSESNRLLRPLFAQEASGDIAGAKLAMEADPDIEDIFFRQAMILPELESKLRRGVKLWEKLVPEEEFLLLLIEDQINRIHRFLADDGRELCKSVAIVWAKAKLRCQKHVGDMESLQHKFQVQGQQFRPASTTILQLQERVERDLQLLQHDVQQQRHDLYQQQMDLLSLREKALKFWKNNLQMWLTGLNHPFMRHHSLSPSSIQRSFLDRQLNDLELLSQESFDYRPPSLTVLGQLLDCMQVSAVEQLVHLSNYKPEDNVRSVPLSTTPDPFRRAPPLSKLPVYSDMWDYFDSAKDVDQWLVPFLTLVCPNLKSFGCVYFPFTSMSLLRAFSSPPLSLSLRDLSMVNADPELNVNASGILQQLIELPPQLRSFRFGAELVFNSGPSSTEEVVTLLSRFSLHVSPTLGLKTLMIEGSIRDFDSRIWTEILRRCSNLETLGLRSYYSNPLLNDIADLFLKEGSCPLLQELCLSGGAQDQDRDLAKFLMACRRSVGGDSDENDGDIEGGGSQGSTILNSRRRGVTQIHLIEADHFGKESYKVLMRCYSKILTHLSIHDCLGPLSFKHRPSSPLLPDIANGEADMTHPILRILTQFESLQVLETFPVQRLDSYPTLETSSGVYLDAYYLLLQYDWISEMAAKSAAATKSVPLEFRPWRCFSTLRVLQVIIGGDLLMIPGRGGNETRVGRDRPAVVRDCRKICKMLGTLTTLEELYLGSGSPQGLSASYRVAHDKVFEGVPLHSLGSELRSASLPLRTTTGSTSASALPKFRTTRFLVKETVIYYGEQIDKRRKQDIQPNCLLLTLESGLDEMADLQALKILDLSFMDHEIGLPELEWMTEHWPSLRLAPGLAREDWSDEINEWLQTNAPYICYD